MLESLKVNAVVWKKKIRRWWKMKIQISTWNIYINISYGSGSVETLSTIYHPIFEKNPCNTNSNIYISREREREREREYSTSANTGADWNRFCGQGVVLTHGNLSAMMSNMVSAWAWSAGDVILHILPLHHVHGVINALMTPLRMGAACLMLPKFDPHQVCGRWGAAKWG